TCRQRSVTITTRRTSSSPQSPKSTSSRGTSSDKQVGARHRPNSILRRLSLSLLLLAARATGTFTSMMSVSLSSALRSLVTKRLKSAQVAALVGLVAAACGGRGSDTIDPNDTNGANNCIGCGDGDTNGSGGGNSGNGDGSGGNGANFGDVGFGEFTLKDDFDGPCAQAETIDINLGNTAESAVRAMHCQIFGTEPSDSLLSMWGSDLTNLEHVRRIDVAWTFCLMADRACDLEFSDSWQSQILLEDSCERNSAGDIGAVFMFFSECPGGVNCGKLWANTHAVGMERQHALFGYDSVAAGFHNPKNTGWWRREFLDARWAGISFLLLNAYGPDLVSGDQPIEKAV